MQSGIQANFMWSRKNIYASGTNRVFLLVEWYGGTIRQNRRRSTPKLIARDVQLLLWLEPNVSLVKVHGAKPIKSINDSIMIPLGHLYDGVKQFIAIEFAFQPQTVGLHGVLSAQWRFKEKNKERMKELPVREIYIQYTYHMGLLQQPEDFYVKKHIKLLETPGILKEAIRLFEHGDLVQGEWMLRRKGDELLINAVRHSDVRLLEEATMLYQLSERYVKTYTSRGKAQIISG
ncbi:hypothetical protein [Paenibacillus pini]|uniref:Uncharacterized protein n=1 Tax=Paenibacillus pini JCM 16418 TaxID=1236976 RepID=W7YCF9_9BACL|nr:hypothetical protein [Paenibacillus pini]GAF08595.1 hypothetical protein JCM16418_2679 [Paenibacillus pini JCM 16418]